MFPVRCYTCNSVVASHYSEFTKGKLKGEPTIDILTRLGVDRMCCRRMFLGHVDIIDDLIRYPNVDVRLDEGGTMLCRRIKMSRTVGCD